MINEDENAETRGQTPLTTGRSDGERQSADGRL